jgi:hypothetical protein
MAHKVNRKRVLFVTSLVEATELEESIEGVDDILSMTVLNKLIKFYIKSGRIKSLDVQLNED